MTSARVMVLWLGLMGVSASQLDSKDLQFQIRVEYTEIPNYSIVLRGNGLGLSSEENTAMINVKPGVWKLDINYTSSTYGHSCPSCSNSLALNQDFEFQAYRRYRDEYDLKMTGPTFRIQMPVSRASRSFEKTPTFTVRPFFSSAAGTVEMMEIESSNDVIGSREIYVYLPPSVKSSPKKVYDVIYLFDYGPYYSEPMTEKLNEAFSGPSVAEAIVIGFGDYDSNSHRTASLCPTPGIDFACAEGSLQDRCNDCIPYDSTHMDTEETIYWLSEGGCGRTIESEGNLDYTINYLVNEVYPEVAAFLASEYSVGITSDRERTMVVGYSDGGLAACYAAWTRSEIFGGAACQSASFWYPFSWTPGQLPQVDFFFINDTLRLKSPTVMDNRNGRYAQNIFIDVGGAEDESVYKMISGTREVAEVLNKAKGFQLDHGLWHFEYPGEAHGFDSWVNRIGETLATLSKNRQYMEYEEK